MSLRKIQEFRLWNFATGSAGEPYTRGYLTNVMGYISSSLFGVSEFSLRLFIAVMGIILIPSVFVFIKKFTNRRVAILTAVGFTFHILALSLARFLRSYVVFLFALLMTFLIWDRLLQTLTERSVKRTVGLTVCLLLSLALGIQANQIAKIAFVLLPLSGVVYFILDDDVREIIYRPRYFVMTLPIIALFVIIFDSTLGLSYLPAQLSEIITLDKISNPTIKYYGYLFEDYVRFDVVFYGLFILGCGVLAYTGVNNRSPQRISLLIYGTVPLFVMIYLFDRFADPRYIYYLIPFVLSIAMVGLDTLSTRVFDTLSISDTRVPLLILLSLTFIYYPVIPSGGTTDDSLAMKAPSAWEYDDGDQLIQRRYVAPEHKPALACLNNLTEPGDNVIIGDYSFRLPYLEPVEGAQYYYLGWYTQNVSKFNSNASRNIFSVMNGSGNTYIITTAAHRHNRKFTQFMQSETISVSKQIGIKKYEYNLFYRNKPFYWPSLNVYSPDGNYDDVDISGECAA
jgi:hypothetical protein